MRTGVYQMIQSLHLSHLATDHAKTPFRREISTHFCSALVQSDVRARQDLVSLVVQENNYPNYPQS